LFDDEERGFITVGDLERVAKELGETMTPVIPPFLFQCHWMLFIMLL
jgi:Ca2+-binding EF-hand superfamily protein